MKFFVCKECKLVYKSKQYAKKCEDFCKKGFCSVEITKNSIGIFEEGKVKYFNRKVKK